MSRFNIFENYTPVGDLIVASICYVMIVLMVFSYVRRSKSFNMFLSIIGMLILASITDVSFYSLVSLYNPAIYPFAYAVRCFYHAVLFTIFLLYVMYIAEVTELESRKRKRYIGASAALLVVVVALDVAETIMGRSVVIVGGSRLTGRRDIFIFGYVAFCAIIIVMMAKVRRRLYKRVMMGFYGTMAVSFVMLFAQGLWGQTSFTVATFLYPVIAMFYILHSNPYDAQMGSIDARALEDMVRFNYEHKREFIFISLYMHDFDEEGKTIPKEIQPEVRRFTSDFFKDATLIMVGRGHMILVFPKRRNPDYEAGIVKILSAFKLQHRKFGHDYKIVVGGTIEEVSRKNEYVSFIRNIHRGMPENAIHRVGPEDVSRFNQIEYILRELEDINRKRDLDDPRVLAYCQPVYNVETGKYDTAEALMRLELPDIGLVYPDQFISLAEEYGYIHVLTQIILHKTCNAVCQLMRSGYDVCRVSVNVSVLELKDEGFCGDIIGIIDSSGVSGDKIAIELTESRNESDFLLMKNKIGVLKERGIKFYLDDFGTGYSNMERIMELPFDIIKFDRSMVVASGSNERSKMIVGSLANMFSELNYSVLYEGVEDESDEVMCEHMSASYLQGYKYSRPVPIQTLSEYFEK